MEQGRFYYCFRCVLLHPDGEECPKSPENGPNTGPYGDKAGTEEGAPEGGAPSTPAILRRTNEGNIRPDENDFAKEMRLSARAMEEAGKLTPSEARYVRAEIAKYKDLPGGKFWRDKEVPFRIPVELRRSKKFFGGL